jgi:aldose 1-epimerase
MCRYLSPDGECGFPGNLNVSINYQLDSDNRLVINYRATTDQDTVVSLANHAYFNLDREQRLIDTHQISIDATSYTPVDEDRIPTGELREVGASRFDLRQLTSLGEGENGLQFDHNFVLPEGAGHLRRVAELYSPDSGLCLRVHTTQPGLQLYTGDYLTAPFHPRQGVCLEAQGFPDAPNQPAFPPARLAAGDLYRQTTIYEFLAATS